MKILFTISLIVFIINGSSANDKLTKAFVTKEKLENRSLSDFERTNLCLELVDYYLNSNIDSAIFFNKEAEKTYHLNYLGKTSKDTLRLRVKANILKNFGLIAFNQGDFVTAFRFHNQTTAYWEKLNDKFQLGISYNNLAVIYKNAGDTEKAFNYYHKGLEILEKTNNKSKIAMIHNNLANLYKELEEYPLALKHAELARDLRLNPYDKDGYASALNNIGNIYFHLNELDSAKTNLLKAHSILDESGHSLGLAFVKKNLAEVYLGLNELDSAMLQGEASLVLAKKAKNVICINAVSKILAETYSKLNSWEKAFEMEKLYASSAEELKIKELNSDLLRSEIAFEYEKKRLLDQKKVDEKLLKSEKEKELQSIGLIAATVIIGLILLFLWFLYKRNKQLREKNAQIEEQNNERKYLLKEVHHRVKNNFQITTSLLRLQSEKIKSKEVNDAFQNAINRLHAMAGVHEIIYKNDSFANMNHGMYIEKLVNGLKTTFNNDRVQIYMELTDKKGAITLSVPLGIIINELITNSYKHAFNENQELPMIHIHLTFKDSNYLLIYKDNGIGFESIEANDSFGFELIQTMVHQLSGTIEYSKELDWNTVISIKFPE